MSIEERKLPEHHSLEIVFTCGNLLADDEVCLTHESEMPEQIIFGLALAIATEPSKLGQLRQMLAHLQAESAILQDFSTWASEQIDNRLLSMALEYAHDAEIIVQILSFRGSTLDGLMHDIEELYKQEQITQRVYVRAKLLLRVNEPSQQ